MIIFIFCNTFILYIHSYSFCFLFKIAFIEPRQYEPVQYETVQLETFNGNNNQNEPGQQESWQNGMESYYFITENNNMELPWYQ